MVRLEVRWWVRWTDGPDIQNNVSSNGEDVICEEWEGIGEEWEGIGEEWEGIGEEWEDVICEE